MAGSNAADKAAIVKVITDEHVAFGAKDYAAVAKCWVHAAYVRHYGPTPNGPIVFKGWRVIGPLLRDAMATMPADNDHAKPPKWKNLKVHTGRDMAWVTDTQIVRESGKTREVVRILEKHEGKWKLVYLSFLPEV